MANSRFRPWRGHTSATGVFCKGYVEKEGLKLAPQVGLEPTTLRLTAECSTIELLRSKAGVSFYFGRGPCECQTARLTHSNHLVQQLRARAGNHNLVYEHPLLADNRGSSADGRLYGCNVAGQGHKRLAAERHRQANFDELNVRGFDRGVGAFDQAGHRKRFDHAERLQHLHFGNAADGGKHRLVKVWDHERIDH